jgi:flagellar basal body-associated protein FliL
MKSFFGMLLVLLVLVAVVGGGALLWYLSDTTEFSRKDAPTAPAAPSSLR